jgi:signal transduction histidine kinase
MRYFASMGIQTVSFIVAAFVDLSLGVAALMRNFRSRLCVAFGFLFLILFVHDAVSVLEGFNNVSAYPAIITLSTLALGSGVIWLLGELLPAFQKRVFRFLWVYPPLLLGALYWMAARDFGKSSWIFVLGARLLTLLPAFLWLSALLRAHVQSKLTRERLRLKYAFLGGALVLCFYLFDVSSFAGFPLPEFGTLARTLYALFIFQTFIQKELVTAEEVVAKIALFSGIALIFAIFYSLLVSWVGDRPGLFFFNSLIASFGVIVLFDPVRNFTSRLTRKLFLEKNTALEDELGRLSSELVGIVEPLELHRRIDRALKASLGVSESRLFVAQADELSLTLVEGDLEIPMSSPLIEYMVLKRGRPFVVETIDNDKESFHSAQARRFCEAALDVMRGLGVDFIVPFMDKARIVGFCGVVTPERIALSNEQLRLFVPVSRQVSLILKNARAFQYTRNREKLAAVGEMAAGLAHEIKNPLGAIRGAAELLRESITGASGEFVKIIIDETDRLSNVVTNVLDYAKPRKFQQTATCNPKQVAEHVISLVQRDSKVRFELSCDETCDLELAVDPEALKQVLLNLMLNSVQALEGKDEQGAVGVRIRSIQPRRLFLGTLPTYKLWEGWRAERRTDEGKRFGEIEVWDNGPGIAEPDLPRVFLPFYTTKPRGTGLGLAICQRLVESNGGTIIVHSMGPSGTRFVIHLPEAMAEVVGGVHKAQARSEARI